MSDEHFNKDLMTLYINTLHGFQPYNQAEIIIGFLDFKDNTESTILKLAEQTNIPKLRMEDYLGRKLLIIPANCRDSIPHVINTLLDLETGIMLQTRLQPSYKPSGPRFSIEQSEIAFYKNMQYYIYYNTEPISATFQLIDPRLWKSSKGKKLSEILNKQQQARINKMVKVNPHLEKVIHEKFDRSVEIYMPTNFAYNTTIDYPHPNDIIPLYDHSYPESEFTKCLSCDHNTADMMVSPCKCVSFCQTCISDYNNVCNRCFNKIERGYIRIT